jgi:hypothetical protein
MQIVKRPSRRDAIQNPNANLSRRFAECPFARRGQVEPLPGKDRHIPAKGSPQKFHFIVQLPQIVDSGLFAAAFPRGCGRAHKQREFQVGWQVFVNPQNPRPGCRNIDAGLVCSSEHSVVTNQLLSFFGPVMDIWPIANLSSQVLDAVLIAKQESTLLPAT